MTVTELTTYQPAPSAVAIMDYQTRAVQRLAEWVQSADAAYTVAQRLCESSFVPQQYRGKPIEATAAILAGSELGLSPMASLRAFDNIQGIAAPKAITLRAIVQSFGHEIVLLESTATRCRMKGRRRGEAEWQTVSWTIDRAKDLGLTGKDNWKKQPDAMLVARATSQIARLIAADAILGIGYSAEEIADGDDAGGLVPQEVVEVAPPEASGTRRMSRAKPTTAPEPDDDGADPITRAQLAKIAAQMRDAGITERDDALAYVGTVVGRKIESRNELTKAEASQVIERLDADLAALGPDADEQQSILDAEKAEAGV